jgi:serine/threonine protein kinase
MKVGYSPEEQYRSKGEQGPWTDIYAVAATIYRAITGDIPPESMDRLAEDTLVPPSLLNINLTKEQEQTLLKALAVRAKDRYQTVLEMQSAFLESPQKTGEADAA